MTDWLANVGAGLIIAALRLGELAFVIWVIVNFSDRSPTRRLPTWLHWLSCTVAGLAAIAFMAFTIEPATAALDRFACRNADDFEMCMDPPDPEF